MAANRALMEAVRGLITYQTLSRLMEIIHIILYKEEVLGALWPERIYTRWPARYHVTRRRAQRDCPSTTPYQHLIILTPLLNFIVRSIYKGLITGIIIIDYLGTTNNNKAYL